MKSVRMTRVRDYSDETSSYRITLLKPMTVREFIETMVAENPGDWGTFTAGPFQPFLCEYKYGEITWWNDELIAEIGDKQVHGAASNGGWSLMNYYIEVAEDDAEANH